MLIRIDRIKQKININIIKRNECVKINANF